MSALLSQFLNKYPYTDFHELNADWMIKTMIDLISQVEDFVSLNAVKYADPIQWNITSQYEKNTIVIDPLTGTAYISVKPVPMGVALTNTDYWTVVFDLGSFVTRAAKNFTDRYEADTTLTATFPSSVGDWLVWGDVLYKVISNIVAGDQYVVDSNIQHFTMEDVYIELVTNILTVDNNLKGSIGVNELDSTTATQNFNAGSLVWVAGQLYMTLTPINAGDTFVSGTNITPVNVSDFVNDRVDNAEDRLRGSIAVNELDSTTATQNFNADSLVWVAGQLYMTLTAINSGDTFVPGTNITPVRVDSYYETLLNNIWSALSVTNATTANKKYLTVGASKCNFTSITTAINYASNYATPTDRVTIFILGGVYYENITLIDNPGIDLIGIGDVQIKSNNAVYPGAPLNFSGSMTCENIQFINENSGGAAYAVHYEAQQSPGRIANQLRFYNCVFGSIGHAALGAGFGDGDDVTFESCKFFHYNNRSAVYMHNYPAGTTYASNVRFYDCLFYTPTDTAIRVDNARARAGSSTNAYLAFTFTNCTAKKACNYVSLVLDAADNYVGYIPKSGEISLSTDSVNNSIIGLNAETADSNPKYAGITFGKPYQINGVDTYVGSAYIKDQLDYDLTLYQLLTFDGSHDVASSTLMNLNSADLVILLCQEQTYTNEVETGATAIFAAVPKKRPTLVP